MDLNPIVGQGEVSRSCRELEQGIYEAVIKAQLQRPHEDDEDGWARWIQELTIYLYEFAIRFREKGAKFEASKRQAWWATKRRIRDETVAKIMDLELPHEEGKEIYRDPDDGVFCECGRRKNVNFPQCRRCAEKRYKEMSDA
jgi:hypothetical protein